MFLARYVLLMIVIMSLFIFSAIYTNATDTPQKKASELIDTFITSVLNEKYLEAYDYFSPDLKREWSYDNFVNDFQQMSLNTGEIKYREKGMRPFDEDVDRVLFYPSASIDVYTTNRVSWRIWAVKNGICRVVVVNYIHGITQLIDNTQFKKISDNLHDLSVKHLDLIGKDVVANMVPDDLKEVYGKSYSILFDGYWYRKQYFSIDMQDRKLYFAVVFLGDDVVSSMLTTDLSLTKTRFVIPRYTTPGNSVSEKSPKSGVKAPENDARNDKKL